MKTQIFTILLSLTLLAGCKPKDETPPAEKFRLTETIAREKELATAIEEQVDAELLLTGKITFDEDKVAKVFPLAGGFVRDLNVELGDYVRKGQTMAVIRSPEIAGFTREGVAAESQLRLAEKNAQVAAELYKTGNLSQVEFINSQKELENAKGELARIKDVLDMYGAASGSTYPIKSPVSGVIIQKNIALNMELRTEDITPAFVVGSLDEIWVMANVYESDIPKIKEGYAADVTTISYPDKVYAGRIDKIFNLMDAETKVVKARVTLKNENFELKPEMFANVRVTYREPVRKMTVPATAIIFDKSRHFVMVWKADDDIETREVTIYRESGDKVYIETGLKAGEKVMTKYQLLVYDALND